jgi:MFS family permease
MNQTKAGYQHYLVVSIAIMIVATALTATQYKLPSIIPQTIEAGLLDIGTITILMSVFSFAGIIFAIPAGVLIGRIGAKKAILLAVTTTCIASCAIFFDNTALLIVFRVFEGISLYMVIVAGPVLIQQIVEPAKRGVATGIYIVGGMLGAFVAGLATPVLFTLGSLVGVWMGYALFALVSGFILFLVVQEVGGTTVQGTVVSGQDSGSERYIADASPVVPTRPSYKTIFSKNIVLLFVSFIIFQIMLIATISFSPTFLQQHGFDPNLSGVVSTLPMLMAILSSVVFGAIADKTGNFKVGYLVGFAAMCISMFLMFTGTGLELWAGVFVMGLLGMGTPAIAMAAYPQMLKSPQLISIGMGVMIVIQCIGQFLGTTLPSLLLGTEIDNWQLMSLTTLVLGAFGLVCALLCKFRRDANRDTKG